MSRKKRRLPSSLNVAHIEGQLVSVNMDEETKQRFARACCGVMSLLKSELRSSVEAFAVLSMCRDTLGEACGIKETVFLQNPTEMKQ